VARAPDGPPGSGLFDGLHNQGDRRRAIGVCVSLAAAMSIARLPLPGPRIQECTQSWLYCYSFVPTTATLTPLLWIVACAVIIVSYARKPAAADGEPNDAIEDAQISRTDNRKPTQQLN